MNMIQLLSFPINRWSHLYSLQQAVKHNQQLSGRKLSIRGRIVNQAFLQHCDTHIQIDFLQVNNPPNYPQLDQTSQQLGLLQFTEQQLTAHIQVDKEVFEELRKNLMEYSAIEGINIMLTLGLLSNNEHFQKTESLPIVQLDYAMKGDA